MSETVKLRADHTHPETLASGRTIAPGEVFNRSDLDLSESSPDHRLIDDELVIEAIVAVDEELTGKALTNRARELGIEGYSTMKADELREAIALYEAEHPEAEQPEPAQRVAGAPATTETPGGDR